MPPTTIGEDPVADSRNGEYVIVKPPSWSQARWDAYQRGLGGRCAAMTSDTGDHPRRNEMDTGGDK